MESLQDLVHTGIYTYAHFNLFSYRYGGKVAVVGDKYKKPLLLGIA